MGSFRYNPTGVTSRSINAMTQVCVFPGHSSVRRSASGLRWPPARAYELCPRISLLGHGRDKAKKLDSAYVNQRQAWYSLQNKFRLNRKGCVRDLRFSQMYKTSYSTRPQYWKRIGLPSNQQRHSQPRKLVKFEHKFITRSVLFRHSRNSQTRHGTGSYRVTLYASEVN